MRVLCGLWNGLAPGFARVVRVCEVYEIQRSQQIPGEKGETSRSLSHWIFLAAAYLPSVFRRGIALSPSQLARLAGSDTGKSTPTKRQDGFASSTLRCPPNEFAPSIPPPRALKFQFSEPSYSRNRSSQVEEV